MAANNLPVIPENSSALNSVPTAPTSVPAGTQLPDEEMVTEKPRLFRTQSRPENLSRSDHYDDDYRSQPRRRGCLSRFLNCRCLGCGCLLLLIALGIATVLVIWQRPPFIWEPVKTWLNAGLTPSTTGAITAGSAYANLNSQVSAFGVGLNTITITEQELQAILRDKLASNNLADLNVDMEVSALKIYWNADTSGSPLWMVVELNTQDKTKVKFNKIGTERIPLPTFLNDLATEIVASMLKFGANKAAEGNLLDVVFTAPANVSIQDIQLAHDQLKLTVNVKNGLDHVFGN